MTRSAAASYTQPGIETDAGPFEPELRALPGDVATLARTCRGLLLHEHLAPFYGVNLTERDRSSVHLRRVLALLEHVVAKADAPLEQRRPAERRVAGNCRHFTVLMVAMLRAHDVPARARCGFGGYFTSDKFEDHWVCEYWRADEQRWALVDAQLDRPQRELAGIEFDTTDVPRDRFLVAGDAWNRCRSGEASATEFGLSAAHEFGAWWIAGNLMRDAAALDNIELLPWDCWGTMPLPDDELDEDRLALFDHLARLTVAPDDHLDELQQLLATDDRVRVPSHVRNALRDRQEPI